jgi:predicted metal-dependent RNase
MNAPTKIYPSKKYERDIIDKVFVKALRIQDVEQEMHDKSKERYELLKAIYTLAREKEILQSDIATLTGVGRILDKKKK